MEVQAVRGHLWAGVGVLLSPRGVDKSQAGVPRASRVEEVDQSVPPPGVVGGPLLAAAIVKVFIGALVDAFPHRCRPQVVVVGEEVVPPVVPMPRRRVWHRRVRVTGRGGRAVGRGAPCGGCVRVAGCGGGEGCLTVGSVAGVCSCLGG